MFLVKRLLGKNEVNLAKNEDFFYQNVDSESNFNFYGKIEFVGVKTT